MGARVPRVACGVQVHAGSADVGECLTAILEDFVVILGRADRGADLGSRLGI